MDADLSTRVNCGYSMVYNSSCLHKLDPVRTEGRREWRTVDSERNRLSGISLSLGLGILEMGESSTKRAGLTRTDFYREGLEGSNDYLAFKDISNVLNKSQGRVYDWANCPTSGLQICGPKCRVRRVALITP